jgi:hypothetical protein
VLQTLSGLFSVVDMLPGSPLSGHLPFVAFSNGKFFYGSAKTLPI